MADKTLYSWHEAQPGKEELLRAAWQRHFHAPTLNCKGLIASTYDNNANRSYIRLIFSDLESLESFETSLTYIQDIWEVLPLLTRKPSITRTFDIDRLGGAEGADGVSTGRNDKELDNAHSPAP